jgi:hypothetical protein
MDAREQLLSEEYLRYGAECRRLARLARRPKVARKEPAGSRRQANNWLAYAWMRIGVADRPLKPAAIWGHR